MKHFEHYLNKVRKRVDESGNNYDLYSTTKNHTDIIVGDKVWSILGPFAGKDKFYGIVDDVQPTELFVTFYDVNTGKKVSASTQMVYDYIHKYPVNIKESSKLRSVTVEYSDGTKIDTSMAAHLTDDEIRDYYKIGKKFNLGNAPVDGDGNYGDNIQSVVDVIINETVNNISNEIKEIESEIQKLKDENAEGFAKDINKLKIKLVALKLMNTNESLKKSDLINILEKYTKWLVEGGKLEVENISELVNQFIGIPESVTNEGINVMSVAIPPVEEWIDIQENPTDAKKVKGFNYMGKTWAIRDKDLPMFKANWGKNVKFKYDSNRNPRFMDFAVVTDPVPVVIQ